MELEFDPDLSAPGWEVATTEGCSCELPEGESPELVIDAVVISPPGLHGATIRFEAVQCFHCGKILATHPD